MAVQNPRGKMLYEFESDVKIDDEILKAELGSNGDVQLKNIVRTIQKEQNSIIRNTSDRIMVIQGAAGSGKTSVALHRIAYLLYHDRNQMKSSNILILSPNSVFSDYISHILPELGEENIREMSFDLFAYKELRDTVFDCEDRYESPNSVFSDYISHILPELGEENIREMSFDLFAYKELRDTVFDCEDRYDQIERELQGDFGTEELAQYERKQSEEFLSQAEGFLMELEDSLLEFRDMEFRGMVKTEAELVNLFYFKFQDIPLLARMDAVLEYFVDEFETLHSCTLSEEDMDNLKEKFKKFYRTMDLYVLYNEFLEECGYRTLPQVSYEKRFLAYEDVYPMLYLKYRLFGKAGQKAIKHLVIDEMQDYSYLLQYEILKGLFPCKMTILGDRAQTMEAKEQDVLTFLPKILGKQMRKIIMDKSYRNTVEIASYANQLTGVTDVRLFERHGKPVEELVFKTQAEALEQMLGSLRLAEDEYETAALITMTEAEASEAFAYLKERIPDISYLDKNSSSFKKGLTVTTFYLAKGLEFDQVLEASEAFAYLKERIPDISYLDKNSSSFKKGLTVTTFYLAKGLEFDQVFALCRKEKTPLLRQAEYICATRALHELYMYTV